MLVIDASVAVKWFVREPLSEDAGRLLARDEIRIAPDHVLAEVGQALLKLVRSSVMEASDGSDAIKALPHLMTLVPAQELAAPAFEIAGAVACTLYDALYIAAADRWGGTLVTADQRLVRSVRGTRWAARTRVLGVGAA